MIVWRDRELVDAQHAVSAEDRGWLVGEAVFETILFDHNRLAFLPAHMKRLCAGMEALGIKVDLCAAEALDVARTLSVRNGGIDRGAFRITVSRVGGRRGLVASPEARAQILASLTRLGPAPDAFKAVLSSFKRWSGSATAGFKCVGAYAENLLARNESSARGADEAIMLNEHGRVACGSSSNIFLIKGDDLLTPPCAEGAMPGIVRSMVIEEAWRSGIVVSETPIPSAMIDTCALLLTNSLIGAVVARVGSMPSAADYAATVMLRTLYERRLGHEFSVN